MELNGLRLYGRVKERVYYIKTYNFMEILKI